MDMSAGSQMNIGPYNLHLQNYDSTQEPNYSAERATIDVDKDGRSVMMLYPDAALLSLQSGIRHDGGDLLDAPGRSLRGLRRHAIRIPICP